MHAADSHTHEREREKRARDVRRWEKYQKLVCAYNTPLVCAVVRILVVGSSGDLKKIPPLEASDSCDFGPLVASRTATDDTCGL